MASGSGAGVVDLKDPHDPFTQEISPLTQSQKGPGRPRQNPAGAKSGAQRAKEYRARKRKKGIKEFTAMVSEETIRRLDTMRSPMQETQGEFLDRLVDEEWARFNGGDKR